MSTEVTATGRFLTEDIVNDHTEAWKDEWKANDAGACEAAWAATARLREIALGHPKHGSSLGSINGAAIRTMALSFRKSTAIGVDNCGFREVAEASEDARNELAVIMKATVSKLAWPIQCLLVIMCLLGKKCGGTRAVAVIATYARLLLALIKEEVRGWDRQAGSEDDTALKGKRPLDETARRRIRVEAAALRGKWSVTILWDFKKFFDYINPEILTKSAVDAMFPMDQLALGLMMHRAPRTLRVAGHYGDVVGQTGRSMLAGCTLSTSLARAYLAPLRAACDTDSTCRLAPHVDDLAQTLVAPSENLAIMRAIRYGRALADKARELGLVIADKSRVVASTVKVARAIGRGLQAAEVDITAAQSAEDLGATSTAGGRKRFTSLTKRIHRAALRSMRIRRLTAVTGKANKLCQSGADPLQHYDDAVQGASPPIITSMRRNATRCVQSAGSHPCTATLLAWRIGSKNDPAVAAPMRQVQLWKRIWRSTPRHERGELREAWRTAVPRILLGGTKWKMVSGPFQATVAVLGQLGWVPATPSCWLAPSRDQYADLDEENGNADAVIMEAIQNSAEEAVWKAAARHYLGAGLEEGAPSLGPAAEAKRWFVRHGRPEEAKAVDIVVCGGAWPGGRDGVQRKCRCGQPEDAFHKYWACPLIEDIGAVDGYEMVASTQWLRDEFQGELGRYQCLWGRGILPRSLADIGPRPQPDNIKYRSVGNFDDVVREAGVVYSDGSGGPAHAPRGAPHAGSGLAAITWRSGDGQQGPCVAEVALRGAGVPGRQTVPRAETWAACIAEESIPVRRSIVLAADASYVVNGLKDSTSKDKLRKGKNGDLWNRLLSRLGSSNGLLVPIKVRAHTRPDELAAGTGTIEEVIGNHLADAAAGAAAEDALSRSDAARAIARWEQRAFCITRRLALIETWHWKQGKVTMAPPAPLLEWTEPQVYEVREVLQEMVSNQGHVLRTEGRWTVCGRCHKKRLLANHRFWTSMPCQPKARGRPVALDVPPENRKTKRARLDPDEQHDVGDGTVPVHGEGRVVDARGGAEIEISGASLGKGSDYGDERGDGEQAVDEDSRAGHMNVDEQANTSTTRRSSLMADGVGPENADGDNDTNEMSVEEERSCKAGKRRRTGVEEGASAAEAAQGNAGEVAGNELMSRQAHHRAMLARATELKRRKRAEALAADQA